MLHQFRLFLLLLALLGCAHPAPPAAPKAEPTSVASSPSGLYLYAVEKGGRRSHLLGTIHLGFGFEEVLSDEARKRFAEAERVITETSLEADASGRMLQAAMLPEGESLDVLLGPAAFQLLEGRLGGQLPRALLMRLRPWLPAVLLSIEQLKRSLDAEHPGKSGHMMDVELMAEAKRSRKALSTLETMDEQLAVFGVISLEEQLSELRHALTTQGADQSDALVKAFESGDEDALANALFEEAQLLRAPKFYQAVLFDRNDRWLPVLEEAFARERVFVGVGAAHLLGARGLLAQLRGHGYQVQRVF